MVTFEEVRKDLRSLKHLEYSIQVFNNACDNLNKQYESYLKSSAKLEEIEKLKESILKLNTEGIIKKSIEKKDKYFQVISKLEPIERTIIIDSVINGVTYWEIGRRLNYSSETIKKKVNKAISKIVEILNNC